MKDEKRDLLLKVEKESKEDCWFLRRVVRQAMHAVVIVGRKIGWDVVGNFFDFQK